MNSAPHLLPEDRPDFARVLDQVLRHANRRPELSAVGRRLNAEQLRTKALEAAPEIAARAAAEYRQYVELRDASRRAPRQQDGAGEAPAGGKDGSGGHGVGFATAVGEAAESSGAGLLAVFAVLAPVLSGAAAAIFLLIGYLLHLVSPEQPMADPIINAGWIFLALTAAGIVIAMFGLLLTALRDGAGSLRASAEDDGTSELARARDAWRRALLDRGIVPFLQAALEEPRAAGQVMGGPYGGVGDTAGVAESRTPHLGYSRPGFSSPATDTGQGGGSTTRAGFDSPGFSSPDYGGPEHQPE
ncbi:hypothetical protein [Streptomyces sp. F63]|uniref:hypothetical protein n=1 Tax=Streptomyces sp. F63 TaxID=2824887 RepID=UPI0027DAB861|nr:hypothetical protein [Streptomyces sp. F63]